MNGWDENSDNYTSDKFMSVILMCEVLFILQRISISNIHIYCV